MPTTVISNHYVFPTESDVNGGVTGAGKVGTEKAISALYGSEFPRVISGFTLPSSGALTQNLTGGSAVVAGYLVEGTGTYSFTFAANATNYMWLIVTKTSGLVISVLVQNETSASTFPTDGILLGTVTTNGSAVTGSVDLRPQGIILHGLLASNGAIVSGSGMFKATRTALGTYEIAFPSGYFRRKPAILVSSSAARTTVSISSATLCEIQTIDASGTSVDSEVSFEAVL